MESCSYTFSFTIDANTRTLCQMLSGFKELIDAGDPDAAKFKKQIKNVKESNQSAYLIWKIYRITDCFNENIINTIHVIHKVEK